MDNEIQLAQRQLTERRNANEKPLAISRKPSVTELGDLMARTQERNLHCPITEIEGTLYLEDWERLATEFGMQQFRRALEIVWTKAKFFPRPGEIRAELENLEPPPEPIVPEYKHFEKPNDPITQEEFSAMLDKYPELDKWR